jgi:hypothetical protein
MEAVAPFCLEMLFYLPRGGTPLNLFCLCNIEVPQVYQKNDSASYSIARSNFPWHRVSSPHETVSARVTKLCAKLHKAGCNIRRRNFLKTSRINCPLQHRMFHGMVVA